MEALRVKTMSDRSGEPGWTGVILLSLFLHVGILSLLLFAPDPFATRKISGPVYEVNLVTLPAAKPKAAPKTVQPKSDTTKLPASTKAKAVATKRISEPPKPEKPVSYCKKNG